MQTLTKLDNAKSTTSIQFNGDSVWAGASFYFVMLYRIRSGWYYNIREPILSHPPKSAKYHFYREEQQGAIPIMCNLKDLTSNSIHMTKKTTPLHAVPTCLNGTDQSSYMYLH